MSSKYKEAYKIDVVGIKVEGVPPSEYSIPFIQGMVSRMGVSSHKYGLIKDAYPDKVNALKSLQQRIEKYLETGNTEYLIDASNFCMIEFMCPSLPNAFFKGTDSDGSPGRTKTSGTVTTKHNLDLK